MGTATLVREVHTLTQPETHDRPPALDAASAPPKPTPPVLPLPRRDRVHPLRRTLYAAFRQLPPSAQQLAIRLCAAKVTYGACAVILDSRGRVLLTHHTYRRWRPWGLPGGLIERAEQPYAAVERELREELGLRATIGPLLYAETSLPAGHLTLYYRVTIAGTPRADGVEIDGFQYVTLDDAAALLGPEARPWLACLHTRRVS